MQSTFKKRTRKQALQHILSEFDAGRLGAEDGFGGCVYRAVKPEADGTFKHCAVGCLFNDAQLDDIQTRGLNASSTIDYVALFVGQKNIEHVTGLDLEELLHIQRMHDHWLDCAHWDARTFSSKSESQLMAESKFRTYLIQNMNG